MSTLAEQVVEQLKIDMDNVYDAGYQKGLKEIGGLDISKFGIQNEVKGTSIVTLDYVNENEHEVEVKLSSDTVTDFSGCKVKCIGKNLWNKDYASNINNWPKDFVYTSIPIKTGKGEYVSISYKEALPTGLGVYAVVTKTPNNSADYYKWLYHSESAAISSNKINFVSEKEEIYITIFHGDIQSHNDLFMQYIGNELQIEISPSATNYEPYTEKTYTANADGTVYGVTSISPTMNIICDGVEISAKHYQAPDVEWHRFWDNLQQYGKLTDYSYAFSLKGWNSKNLKPKYDIIANDVNTMFRNFQDNIDLTEHLEKIGIVFDTSKATNFSYIFAYSKLKRVPLLDMTNATQQWQANYMFTSSLIETIDGLRTNGTFPKLDSFTGCSYLKNITFEGVIGDSISLQWSSMLTVESAKNIIQCLANLIDTNPFTQTITFHANVWTLLEAEGNASPNGSTWKEYIESIGWLSA